MDAGHVLGTNEDGQAHLDARVFNAQNGDVSTLEGVTRAVASEAALSGAELGLTGALGVTLPAVAVSNRVMEAVLHARSLPRTPVGCR